MSGSSKDRVRTRLTPRGLNSGKKGLIRKGSFEVQREAVATRLVETVSAGSSARCVNDRGIPPDQHLKPSFDSSAEPRRSHMRSSRSLPPTRRALQASEALEKQVTWLISSSLEASIHSLWASFTTVRVCLAADDPPCIGSKGS